MKKRIEDLIIHGIRKLESNYILLELRSESDLSGILPGQFVEILVPDCRDTFLRRPISIYDVDAEKGLLKFLIKIVGCGTETLAKKKKDDILNVIFPLGNGYTVIPGSNILFIGGGYGIAPFLYFGRILNKMNIRPKMLFGARQKEDFVLMEEFEKYGDLYLTTEDGSAGEKGLVTDHSILYGDSAHFDRIYSCGPEAMMKAVAGYAYKRNIPCEVSLDNLMACGIGVCLCCITETVRGNEIVCTQGPVFNINDLKWQN